MSSVYSSINRLLPKSKLTRNVAVLSAGSLSSQLIMLLATPVATRLYSPADFGILSVFNSILALFVVAAGGRYEFAVTISDDDESAINILGLSLIMIVCSSAVVGAAVWVAGEPIVDAINASALVPFLWLIPIKMIGDGLNQTLSYWTVRTKRFGELAKARFSQSVGGNTSIISLGFLSMGPLGLLIGSCITNLVGAVMLARSLLRNYRCELKQIKWQTMWRLAKRYRKFPFMSAPSALINNAAFILPPMLLVAFYDTEAAGLFGLAVRMVGLPMTLIGAAVAQVFLSETSETMRHNKAELPEMFNRMTFKMLKVSVLVIVFGCMSPYLFAVIFGEQWRMAGLYSSFLSVFAAAQLVVSPISCIVIVMERQDLQMVGDIIRCLLVVLSLVIPHWFGWPADAAVASYSIAMAITYAGYYIMYRHVVSKVCCVNVQVSQS